MSFEIGDKVYIDMKKYRKIKVCNDSSEGLVTEGWIEAKRPFEVGIIEEITEPYVFGLGMARVKYYDNTIDILPEAHLTKVELESLKEKEEREKRERDLEKIRAYSFKTKELNNGKNTVVAGISKEDAIEQLRKHYIYKIDAYMEEFAKISKDKSENFSLNEILEYEIDSYSVKALKLKKGKDKI